MNNNKYLYIDFLFKMANKELKSCTFICSLTERVPDIAKKKDRVWARPGPGLGPAGPGSGPGPEISFLPGPGPGPGPKKYGPAAL